MRELTTVKGFVVREGKSYKGKRVRPGIFINITGWSEQEKEKRELGEEGRGLDRYEVIEV
jgi:hypothetical protein